MTISVFDIFKIGIGPSSSHTVGPMKAALQFAQAIPASCLADVYDVTVELYGSLGATGKGHGTDKAVMLGLMGETPEGIDPNTIDPKLQAIETQKQIQLLGQYPVFFDPAKHIRFYRKALPFHANGMRFTASEASGREILTKEFYSVGGGFIVSETDTVIKTEHDHDNCLPFPFKTADRLLALCKSHKRSISEIMLQNEKAWLPEQEIRSRLLNIWHVMQACVDRGLMIEGHLPGGMKVKRRAPALFKQLSIEQQGTLFHAPTGTLDWVNLFALAVSEENASGGRVVTAPTNGAAGIIPAVLHYYWKFCEGANEDGVVRFLLSAGAIGFLYKENASISGAEVGCQGEVGVACSMAAGALAEVLGGTPAQVENAAEIGMEHNLGLTCDPVGGLVQVPCIERNAMGAVKAINAARIAMRGDGTHYISLDKVIRTMRQTGADMKTKYKETSRGGLAVNLIEC
jgi:L-serine dehydratase